MSVGQTDRSALADAKALVRASTAESVRVHETDAGWYWVATIGPQSWTGLAESREIAWAHATARIGANR